MEIEDIINKLKTLNHQRKANEIKLKNATFIYENTNSMVIKAAAGSGKSFQLSDARGNSLVSYSLENEDLKKLISLGLSGYKSDLEDELDNIEKDIKSALDDEFINNPVIALELFNKLIASGQATKHMRGHIQELIIKHSNFDIINKMIHYLRNDSYAVRYFYIELIIKIRPENLPEILKISLENESRDVVQLSLKYIKESFDKILIEYVANLYKRTNNNALKSEINKIFGNYIIKCIADTLEEAKNKLNIMLPNGFVTEKIEVISDGLEKKIVGDLHKIDSFGNYNGKNVLDYLKVKIPNEATIIEEKILRNSTEERFIEIYTEYPITSAVPKEQLHEDEEVQMFGWELIKHASKGFFGLGKKPNKYRVSIRKYAKAEIRYKPKAELEVHLKL